MENIAIWQKANGRFSMIAFWIMAITYAYTGQIVPGIW